MSMKAIFLLGERFCFKVLSPQFSFVFWDNLHRWYFLVWKLLLWSSKSTIFLCISGQLALKCECIEFYFLGGAISMSCMNSPQGETNKWSSPVGEVSQLHMLIVKCPSIWFSIPAWIDWLWRENCSYWSSMFMLYSIIFGDINMQFFDHIKMKIFDRDCNPFFFFFM